MHFSAINFVLVSNLTVFIPAKCQTCYRYSFEVCCFQGVLRLFCCFLSSLYFNWKHLFCTFVFRKFKQSHSMCFSFFLIIPLKLKWFWNFEQISLNYFLRHLNKIYVCISLESHSKYLEWKKSSFQCQWLVILYLNLEKQWNLYTTLFQFWHVYVNIKISACRVDTYFAAVYIMIFPLSF